MPQADFAYTTARDENDERDARRLRGFIDLDGDIGQLRSATVVLNALVEDGRPWTTREETNALAYAAGHVADLAARLETAYLAAFQGKPAGPSQATAPNRALNSSPEEQLLELAGEFERRQELMDRMDDLEESGAGEQKEAADLAGKHAVRIQRDILAQASHLAPTTPLGWALKARMIERFGGALWDDENDELQRACRGLLRQLMAAGGVAPIPRRDITEEELTRGLDKASAS